MNFTVNCEDSKISVKDQEITFRTTKEMVEVVCRPGANTMLLGISVPRIITAEPYSLVSTSVVTAMVL